ncbi:conserved protein of unknown function [Rhodovastum atsumiense]|uniref:DUF1254 domain-containing protein n=1 Tax=Rhodovastum atsumiense TaxID=504468 RepID=A0A5M6IQ44_9PROT|nr:DUF1254 domain-containing protein [Rhodovastum atsumiense]KAA5610027.1 DUF1254 domain-containing protein [Rhodovastum atsumiense]CAH2602987.1 conserved protein of unknown function [Rhodovastum atsumiense]
MRITRRDLGLGLLFGAAAFRPAQANWDSTLLADVEGLEEFLPAINAYIYGYSLVTLEMTRRVITNVVAPAGTRGPMGQFIRLRQYPDASFRDITAPNADTLYTTAFVDVGKEPWVLSLPDMQGRYFLFPLLDAWTNVFQSPGSRTTGTGAQTYAITGPGWRGSLPPGVVEYKSPTSLVWVLGRIYCSGTPEDYAAVHALQDACQLVPLSAWGKEWTPPPGQVDPAIDMKTPVRTQVNRLDAATYFTLLARLLKDNPPAAADAPILPTLAQLGIVPGQDLDRSRFNVDFASRVPQLALDRIKLHFRFSGGDMQNVKGWIFTTKTGQYGTDYLQRALVAMIGLGANLPQDAVYPVSKVDADGKAYNGANSYVLHFPKGAAPPAKGFWSLTMYDEQLFFVPNTLNRYSISLRQTPRFNADGSLDLLIQHASPGPDKEANWLPAPAGGFVLMLRMYWPDQAPPSILDGSWTPPGVIRQG